MLIILSIGEEGKRHYPPGMRRRSNVSFRYYIGRDVADHAETSSRHCNWYVNDTDLIETCLPRLIDTYIKQTNLRRRNDVLIDT